MTRSRTWRHAGAGRLVVIAALFHLCLAVALFVAGRTRVAPALIDRDGIMASFAFDSYAYQRGAIEAAAALRAADIVGWATAAQPLHVKLIAVSCAGLSPLFGCGPLSAEPFNLVCYVAIVVLVFAVGRELGGDRAATLAAMVVALWPTFLLHTLQLLKDPMFVAAALAFVLCAVRLLMRTCGRRTGASLSVAAVILVLLLASIRFSFVLLMVAVALLVLLLLVLRQAREGRRLAWNMAPALAVVLTGVLVLPSGSTHTVQRRKQSPAVQRGPLKSDEDPSRQVRTIVRPAATADGTAPAHVAAVDKFARRISSMRSRFAASYPQSGSLLDTDAAFRNVGDMLRYVPRAAAIGLWAPFPSMWRATGKQVGHAGRLVSAAETFAIYVLQGLAVIALVRGRRRMALWFVAAIVVCGVTALAFVVPNIGALYRFRYLFWILLVVLAMTGVNASGGVRLRRPADVTRVPLAMSLAALLVMAGGCSSAMRTLDPASSTVVLTNVTGATFRAVYLSPSSAPGWQENVLASSALEDGDTLEVLFAAEREQLVWDLRVEGLDGRYAEWKGLNLTAISDVTLSLEISSTPVAVAEVE